ncbi:alpha methylacyl- racemase protein [Purpureocillium lavendulum]|uniref:Alpha methylacyl- racemase protein n=1 Tax=Purpureocillium lavendulum TaxID=1247861 RepID=A0AB34FYX4_9HYPO|nr:alpha methylacyl- racemase protein [Purpureocillium lavendulum]
MSRKTVEGVYGDGTYTDAAYSPLPVECHRLLQHFANASPGFTKDAKAFENVRFYGGDLPLIPGPLKSQALSAVLHAMTGVVGKEICALKGIDAGKIAIDVDKSGLYPATAALVSIDGKTLVQMQKDGTVFKAGKDLDRGVLSKTHMRYRSWAIYPTKDQHVWYQVLGNFDPVRFLRAYGLDADAAVSSRDEAYETIKRTMVKYSAPELELKNMEYGFCGQTCYTPKQWRNTTMGQRLQAHPLVNYRQVKGSQFLPPIPFPVLQDKRPLAGIKVVELARVIAGPAMGAALAALGADVIKVQSPNLSDLQLLSVTFTAGKRTCALDLNVEGDREQLRSLIADADVVIQAFRLRSLERRGFGLEDVLEMANKRGKGIVYIDLNCYGPDGYYAERPGFQQIADAATGCSYVCGKAYGFDEGVSVLPSLPIADMLSGTVGVIDAMLALRDRAIHGGSYHATVALAAVDAVQLDEEVGLYPPEIVKEIQERYKFGPMTPDLHVEELLSVVVGAWAGSTDVLRRSGYMVKFAETAWGNDHEILSPIVDPWAETIAPALPARHRRAGVVIRDCVYNLTLYVVWNSSGAIANVTAHLLTMASKALRAGSKTLVALDIGLSRPAIGESLKHIMAQGEVLRLPARGGPLTSILKNPKFVSLPDGVVYSRKRRRLYYTNMGVPRLNDGTICSVALDGSDPQTVVNSGQIHTPKQLALDTVNEKLYISDREGMKVVRCNLDGSALETLIKSGDVEADGIAEQMRWCVGIVLSQRKGLFYWTQKGPSKGGQGRIFCAPIDSDGPRKPICVLDKLPEPIDLHIDEEANTLYWTDRGELPFGNTFNRLRLDDAGTGPEAQQADPRSGLRHEILVQNFDEAIGLAFDADTETWFVSDLGGAIWTFDKDGGNRTKLFEDKERAFTGIVLVEDS